jgi:hypothetical protein
MRNQLLATAAILAMAAAVPAFAQTPQTPTGTVAGGTDPNWPAAPLTDKTNAQIQHGTTGATAVTMPDAVPASTVAPMPASQPVTPDQTTSTHSTPAQTTASVATTPAPMPNPGPAPARMTRTAFTPGHEAMSTQASNISPADTHSDIAPALPAPSVGPDATADQLLQAAKMSLDNHQSGAAQEALERAETRLLDRSTAPSDASAPDQRPRVQAISQALNAIGRHDWQAAHAAIDNAMRPNGV